MGRPQHAILTNLAKYQWYTHMSRTDGADLGVIKEALAAVRARRDDLGLGGSGEPGRLVGPEVSICLLFGPTLLADLTDDIPDDFQPYPGYQSPDGSKV